MPCFDECGCTCGEQSTTFDETIALETRLGIGIRDVIDDHIGWYLDRHEEPENPSMIGGWGLDREVGVYILWLPDDYCLHHNREHFVASYVGKGRIGARLRIHWATKDVGRNVVTHFTVWRGSNRLAKYVEQLLLDVYQFPLNKSENSGRKRLCNHVEPAEWN